MAFLIVYFSFISIMDNNFIPLEHCFVCKLRIFADVKSK